MVVDADGGRGGWRGEGVMCCYVRADHTKWALEKHCGCVRACLCVCEWWACRRTIKPVSSFYRHTPLLVIPFLLRLFCSSPCPSSLLFLSACLVYFLSLCLHISTSPSSLHLSSFILLLFPSLASPTISVPDFCPVLCMSGWPERPGWPEVVDTLTEIKMRSFTCKPSHLLWIDYWLFQVGDPMNI